MTSEKFALRPLSAAEARPWRELHRREMNCQIIHDSWLGRGWVDVYGLLVANELVGYCLVGGVRGEPKDTIIELYLRPEERGAALPLLKQVIEVSDAKTIEVQTNERLLTLLTYDLAREIHSSVILFADVFATTLPAHDAVFRRATPADATALASANLDVEARYVLESAGVPIAAGGVLTHYNPPYGDIYMAVAANVRRRGYGSYFVQELKRAAYEAGLIPAARCNSSNAASRATLQRAGLLPCARMIVGTI